MNSEPIKGFRDYTGIEAWKRLKINELAKETFISYGFEPTETPIIENEELVIGNNPNDEAVSDRYKLIDKGKRKLALRYELTFQLKRISNNKKLPYRRFQIGPVFRDEPVTGNRVRQLTQCDIDIIGSTIKDEAELLKTYSELLEKLNIDYVININNRKLLDEILNNLKINETDKEQVIREIDKLDKLPKNEVKENLKKYNAENALEIFTKPEEYFEKFESYKLIKELKESCKLYNVKINFIPYLARGLAYYKGSVFEIKTKKIKETICGGGSYIINQIPCTGISASIERLEILTEIKYTLNKLLIVSLNQDKKAIEIAQKLKNKNLATNIFYNKPSKALEYANSYNYPFVLFIGENEVKSKKFKLKDMNSGKEESLDENLLIKKFKFE